MAFKTASIKRIVSQQMHNNLFDHLLVTRFSYRGAGSCSIEIDPLNKHRLEKRFDIFEAVCLPSILAQREKKFTWVLIIDAKLPRAFRTRLDRLVEGHDFIRLHVYEAGTEIETLGWLNPYLNPAAQYVITTALDDDDALCTEYIHLLHDHIRAIANTDAMPDLKLFGCTNAMQWDYYPAGQSPLGYLKPWLRSRQSAGAFPLQSGFTALSRKGLLDFSGYYFRHSLGDQFLIPDADFDQLSLSTRRRIQTKRDALKNAVAKTGQDWGRLCAKGAFLEVSPEQPCVLLVNTMTNLQMQRLFEYPSKRRPVVDESSFAGFGIDLDSARRSIPLHGCALPNFLASVLPIYTVVFKGDATGSPARFLRQFKTAIKITLRCIRGIFDLRK